MAHPYYGPFGQAGEQGMGGFGGKFGGAEFGLVALFHLAAESGVQELVAVTKAQDGYFQGKPSGVGFGGVFAVNRKGAAGENDPYHLFQAGRIAAGENDFGINAQLPNAPGDEVGVLASKIHYGDFLHGA